MTSRVSHTMESLQARLLAGRRRRGVAVFPILIPALLCVWCVFAQDPNPAGVTMTRFHASEYAPGQPLEIMLLLEAAGAPPITALGIRETIPEEWHMMEVRGIDGQPPAVHPEPGAGPWLEFIWITPPPMPHRFVYTVWIPESEGGARQVSGDIEYRLHDGPYHVGPVVTVLQGPERPDPTILLRGDNPLILRVGDPWSDPGYTALDHKNADITSRVAVSGVVDTTRPGEYRLLYRVSSEDGTQHAETVRIVRVVADPETPAPPPTPPSRPAPPGTVYPGGRELSNPIATGTREKPLAPDFAPPLAPDVSVPKREMDFPDLSGYRPVPVEPSVETDGRDARPAARAEAVPDDSALPRDRPYAGRPRMPDPPPTLAEQAPSPREAAPLEPLNGDQTAGAQETASFPEPQGVRTGMTGRTVIAGMAVVCLAGFGVAFFARTRTPRNRK